MIELLIVACLGSGECRDFPLLYDSREVSLMTCQVAGQTEVARWQSGHLDWRSCAGVAASPTKADDRPDDLTGSGASGSKRPYTTVAGRMTRFEAPLTDMNSRLTLTH